VIVDDLDPISIAIAPYEANSPLVVIVFAPWTLVIPGLRKNSGLGLRPALRLPARLI
jgi:hypothetical protein